MPDFDTADLIQRLPCWQGSIQIAPLVGGMTNRNYVVTDAHAGRFVVRVGRDLPEHGVMRFNELAAARAAYAAGISPEVVFATDGMLVCRYVESHTLAPDDIRKPQNLLPIVDLIRRCHYEIPKHFQGPALAFWVFQVIRNYFLILEREQQSGLKKHIPHLRLLAEKLEATVGPVTLVFGHNDLLAANFLDDGERLWLIDWDYAGFNSPLFDLANLSSNNAFNSEQDAQLLQSYFGSKSDKACRRAFEAMKCASLLRETLWGGVSELRSKIDFDYQTYTQDYLQRLDQACSKFLAFDQ